MVEILVVDDEKTWRDYLRDVLEAVGYRVAEAADGPSALATLDHQMPDCIVLDLIMPGLSGFETLRSIRRRHDPLPPVLVISSMLGNSVPGYATKVNKADGFVAKATIDDLEEGLLTQIRRVLPQPAARG